MGLEPGTTDRDISDFLLHTCHDLRTHLRSIRTHAELLLRGLKRRRSPALPNPSDSSSTAPGESICWWMASPVIRLRCKSRRVPSRPRQWGLFFERLWRGWTRKYATTTLSYLMTNYPACRGNPDRLIQVFENLLCNALRHRGEASPRIHITAEKQAEEWRFAVRDNGPGVEPAYLETVFKPFERLPGRQRSGPGLGLAICRAIVERHGGRIWAESNDGTGCTFLFTLPAD